MNRLVTDGERGAKRKWSETGQRTDGAGDTFASRTTRERVKRDQIT